MAARFLGLATSMALLLPGCSPMQSQQHSSGPANGQVWHLHEVFYGEQYKNFETGAIDNVKAVKLLVPEGWTFAARPSFLPDHKMDCNYTAGRWDYQAASADAWASTTGNTTSTSSPTRPLTIPMVKPAVAVGPS